jgi:hypothetical protein
MELFDALEKPQTLMNLMLMVACAALWREKLKCDREKAEIWKILSENFKALGRQIDVPARVKQKLAKDSGMKMTLMIIVLFFCFACCVLAQSAVSALPPVTVTNFVTNAVDAETGLEMNAADMQKAAFNYEQYLSTVHDLKPDMYIVVMTCGLGYFIRRVNWLSNQMIWPVCIGIGTLYLALIPTPWKPFLPTLVHEGLYGVMLGAAGGMAAWALHNKLGVLLAQKFPVLSFLISDDAIDITPEELVEQLYETYSTAVGGKNFQGDPLPDWRTFSTDPTKTKQSSAWEEVAKKAIDLT